MQRRKRLSVIFSLGCCTFGNLLSTNVVDAQEITSDGTTSTQVNSDNNGNFTIEQGDRAGDNLFHSFDRFSVPTNGSALFNNATDVSNIFSRVTGGDISDIDGLIGANGSANLFLVNPAGIMFGSNARLEIGGSFLGTTADSILFDNGTFSAVDLENPPLLTINAPIGLNFRDNPAAISNQSTTSADFAPEEPSFDDNLFGIRVPDGKTFALAGGDIDADAGGIVAVGGGIELGAVAEAGTLDLILTDNSISFDFPDALTRGNVSLTNNAGFLVAGNGGGNIAITANNIEILAGSGLFAGIFSGLGSVDALAGDIVLNASNQISLTQNSNVNNNVGNFNATATGNSGDIFVRAKNLAVEDGSAISVTTFGLGNAGNLNIEASENVVVSGETEFPGGLFAQVDTNGRGNGGNLNIETQSLQVSDGSKIQVSTFGLGNAGNLNIKAVDVEVFIESSETFFSTGIFAETSIAQMENVPGNLGVGAGTAGNLFIDTERLTIRGGGRVSASTFGDGDAGTLTVTASDFITVTGQNPEFASPSVLRADVIDSGDVVASGEGGDLTIKTGILNITDGGRVSTSTFAIGDAGSTQIRAFDSIKIDGLGSGIFAEAAQNADGRGGEIAVRAKNLSLSNSAQILAATPLDLGGNISLQIDNTLTLNSNSLISAQAFNDATGGNVSIDTDFIIAFPDGNNDIIANARRGEGGVININAESILGITERPLNDRTNDINASSEESSLDGDVVINTSDINPIRGTVELPSNPVNVDRSVVRACSNNQRTGENNSFIVKGKGGIPANPAAPLTSDSIATNRESISQQRSDRTIVTAQGKIVPARGAIKTKDGRILLTATSSTDYLRSPEGLSNCNGV